jgi:hypothetical protein
MIYLTRMISILNFVITIVFNTTRWTKLDTTCIYFEEFLNQLNCYINKIFCWVTSSGVIILDGLVSSTLTTRCIPHVVVPPCSRRCWFSPSSTHHRHCGCRCSLPLPQTLHRRSSLHHFALSLSLALGWMGIRISVLSWYLFWSSS